MPTKPKRKGLGLDLRSFTGKDGRSFLVFRTTKGSFHVFEEVEAKEAARQCGATLEKNTRSMWKALWERGS